ncbi:short transient receptor potential channel 3-like [Ischnura elegans]|uniref:short transient receptor potential channel 3-like n=1 Tax=Ischnura elegans TaxID=197161 RepID=UPI001ED89B22|nr:short transient receptor potential channel 3-like [Ischnura elegans]
MDRFFSRKQSEDEDERDLIPSGPAGTFRSNFDPDEMPPPPPESPPPMENDQNESDQVPMVNVPSINVSYYGGESAQNLSGPSIEGRESRFYTALDEDFAAAGLQQRTSEDATKVPQVRSLYNARDSKNGPPLDAPRLVRTRPSLLSQGYPKVRNSDDYGMSSQPRQSQIVSRPSPPYLVSAETQTVKVGSRSSYTHLGTSQVRSFPNADESKEPWRPMSKQLLEVPHSQAKPSFLRSRHSLFSGNRKLGDYQRLNDEDDEEFLREIPLDRQPSIVLPILAERERLYFDLVGSGDVNQVKEFLKDSPGFNINCVDFEGHSALHVAVYNGDEAMVSFLLEQRHIEVGDCALHAVRLGNANLVTVLLDELSSQIPNLEFCGVPNSSDFSSDITPLILAAHCGHYEIIGMLLERGHKLVPPHHPRCTCKEVCQARQDELFRLSTKYERLNLYRALASPAYICHTSSDPILTAFQLCVELQQRSNIEEEFRSVYVELAKEVRAFPVALIGCCRTEEEVEVLLSLSAGCDCPGQFQFPRLELAVDCYQKEFVAHPNVQHALRRAWLGDYYKWHTKNYTAKALSVLPRIPMIPVIVLMCMIAPTSKQVKYWSLPVNRMISSLASYLVFLVLIFIESNQDKKKQLRGPPQSGLEGILVLFVVSHVFSSIRLCLLQGPRRFFRHLWNWYDLINQLLFVLAFLFWLAALIDVHKNGGLTLERKYWDPLDPTLLAEGCFAVATILSFSKLLLLCQLNFYLGPLQVSLGKMTKDLAKFLVIFIVIIISFTAGLCRLYHYYQGMIQTDVASGQKTTQVSSFVNVGETVKTLFWAILCMAPLESADVIIEDLPSGDSSTIVINKHVFTETVGYIAFGLFEVMSVIVILNMLIAAMSNTYQKVADNVDIEWTFGRSQVYLGYLSQTVLPPPFNLLPTPSGLSSMGEWCLVCVRPSKGRTARFSLSHCCYVEREEPTNVKEEYPEIISMLAQRYFTEKQPADGGAECGMPASSNLDNLKREITELKTLLKECLTSRS